MSLNKKRIGELYDLPIVTGDQNMVNNHELLLEINDDNTPKALKQRVNGDQFKTILGEGSGGSNNPGYNVTKQTVTLFNDTIEMIEVQGIYGVEVSNPDFNLVAGETYTVVFDGVSYDIEATEIPNEGGVVLGEFDQSGLSFDAYPFIIIEQTSPETVEVILMFGTPTEGPHTFVIKHEEETVTPTPEFKDAVDSVTGYSIDKEYETLYDGTVEVGGSDSDSYFSGRIVPTITFVEGYTYKVTFNGAEYVCECFSDGNYLCIGALYIGVGPDWSTYPFEIERDSNNEDSETVLNTNQEGSCTLKIEHLTVSTKTTPEFVSMIHSIAGSANCRIIYPDDIVWTGGVHSRYNKEPEAGNIYFIPLTDVNSTQTNQYLYPVYIEEFNKDDGSGTARTIGTIIVNDNNTLTVLPFNSSINPQDSDIDGLCIGRTPLLEDATQYYKLFYGKIVDPVE